MSTSMTSVPRAVGDVAQRPAHPRRARVGHLHEGEVGQHAHRPGRPAFSAPARRRGPGRRGRRPRPGARRASRASTSRQPGRPGSRVVGPHPHHVGQGQGDHVGARGRGQVGRLQLLLVDLLGGQAAEQVPVERPVGGQRHVGHQLHPLVGDGADGGDELERGAGVVPQGAGQGHELVEGGRSATGPGGGRRRGGPRRARTRTRGPRRPATPRPARPWPPAARASASLAGGGVAHDHPADGRVPDQEAGVDGQAAVDPVEVLARTSASPTARRPRGPRGGCPRPPPSCCWM